MSDNGLKILVFRNGGYGDILLTTPALRGLKEKYPGAQVHYLCQKDRAVLVRNNPYVDKVLTHESFWPPFPEFMDLAPRYDVFFDLYLAAENEYYLKNWDRIEAFCDVVDVRPSSYDTVLQLSRRKERVDEKLIAVQTEGAAAERCWPTEHYLELIEILRGDGFRVLLLGSETFEGFKADGVVNLCGKTSFEESLFELTGCAALVGPDSAFYHCAAALDKPFVVIIGPFEAPVGSKHYAGKRFRVVRNTSCAPCFHNPRCGITPTNVEQRGQAECMRAATPSMVHQAVCELLPAD